MRAPTKNSDGKTPSDIFMSACPHPSPLGCLLAWFSAVSRISARCQRASITLPRATFHACATRKHFTRRSNDRRISCLCDSADISPPGAACPACPHPSPLGLYGLGCGSNNDSYAPTNRFRTHSCSPPLGCLLAWFYAVSRISARCQRASITLPRATFYACATAQTFHRRARLARLVLALGLYYLEYVK